MPPATATGPTAAGTLRVVVADDNADLARVLGEVLDGEPDLACVGRVAVGDRVVAACRAAAADVLLLDVRLEDGPSLGLLDELRRELPELRVLVVSGYAMPGLEAEALRRGAAAFVPKNGEMEALLARIRAAAGRGAAPGR